MITDELFLFPSSRYMEHTTSKCSRGRGIVVECYGETWIERNSYALHSNYYLQQWLNGSHSNRCCTENRPCMKSKSENVQMELLLKAMLMILTFIERCSLNRATERWNTKTIRKWRFLNKNICDTKFENFAEQIFAYEVFFRSLKILIGLLR